MIFVIVIEALSREFRVALPWELLYADDLFETEDDLIKRLNQWKDNQSGFIGARDSEWQWHQLGDMQICTSLQTDNRASTPPLSILQAG